MRRVLASLVAAAAVALPLAPAVASRHHGVRASKKAASLRFGKPRVKDLAAHPRVAPVVKPPPTSPSGSGSGGGGSATPAPTYATTRLSVRSAEYSLTLSSNPVAAGDALVELANVGEDAHNLVVVRTGGTTPLATFPPTPAGERSKERFKLAPGSYELYCTLLDHRDRGMDALLTVR